MTLPVPAVERSVTTPLPRSDRRPCAACGSVRSARHETVSDRRGTRIQCDSPESCWRRGGRRM